jgi:hypothetical protein
MLANSSALVIQYGASWRRMALVKAGMIASGVSETIYLLVGIADAQVRLFDAERA